MLVTFFEMWAGKISDHNHHYTTYSTEKEHIYMYHQKVIKKANKRETIGIF